MRIDGVLKSWDDARGFGFIEPVHGGQEVFVHISACERRATRPQAGERLSFEVEIAGGRKRAKRVQFVRSAGRAVRRADVPAQWGTASYFAILGFVLLYLLLALLWRVPNWVGGLYLLASVVCYIAYRQDKAAAQAGGWRTAEQTLILLGLVGGWPGAVLAQQVLRHKSNKAAFRAAFWGSVLANVALFVALNSPWLGILS